MYESIGQGIWYTLKLDSLARYIYFFYITLLTTQFSSSDSFVSWKLESCYTEEEAQKNTQTDGLFDFIHTLVVYSVSEYSL